MLQKLTETELEFMELWHYPPALVECLFSNFDNLAEFDEERMGSLRQYQYPMISFEPTIDDIPGFTEKQNFQLRKNVGDVYNFCSRKVGKTLITEKVDIPISLLHDAGWKCGFASYDAGHIDIVLDDVKRAMENHPIIRGFTKRAKTHPQYLLEGKNGWMLYGINMNIKSKSPGSGFIGKHMKKLYIEEGSYETEEVFNKRQDSLSEFGAVFRFSGMTNFTKHTPAGRAFYKYENRKKIINLPQAVNPYWDAKEKQNRLEEYGGEESPNYRIFVNGEVIEDGVSEFDIERVKACYNEKKRIKRFELKREDFSRFKDIIIVERPKNIDRIFIAGDIGDGAGGSDIIIMGEVGDKYVYLYNIILYSFTEDEQEEVFDWLIQNLEANIVATDNGDGTGRGLYHRMSKKYPQENLVRYFGNKKIIVGYEKDEKGNIKMVKGQPVCLEEFMSEWSVRRLKVLLYEGRCIIPMDAKFDNQINSVISTRSGTRTLYGCPSQTGDHLFDAWRVFTTAQWLCKDFNATPNLSQNWGSGACSWTKPKITEER